MPAGPPIGDVGAVLMFFALMGLGLGAAFMVAYATWWFVLVPLAHGLAGLIPH